MALSEQEKQIVLWGKDNGKSLTEVKAALANYRNKTPEPQKVEIESRFTDKAQKALGTIFGGEKIGEAIGTQIAKSKATDEEKQFIEGPTTKEVAGDVLRTGALFTPIGKISKAVGVAGKALGLTKGMKTLGGIIGGGIAGGAADAGISMSEGEDPKVGVGTLLGVGLPATSPILGALSKVVSRGAGRVATETTGVLTGTSQETIEQAYLAAKAGGKELDQFTLSLRGKLTPEQIVNSTRENIALVNSGRQQMFKETLEELGDVAVTTGEAKQNFLYSLNQAGIKFDIENQVLDFTNSKLRTVPNARNKVIEAWNQVYNLPTTASLKEVDTARQAIKALELAGDDASANLGNKLVTDAQRAIRGAGEQVEGYGKMLDNFAETSGFLDELERGLSTGDSKTIDQAYRRMVTALKTNNEQRMQLVKELDQMTDSSTIAQISGQQLSELYPRGLFRQILAGGATVSAVTGSVTPAIIPSLVLASPRVVGEFARALGISASKTQALIDAVSGARGLLIKAGALTGAEIDNNTDN